MIKRTLISLSCILVILLAVAHDSDDYSYVLDMIPGTKNFRATWLVLWIIVAFGVGLLFDNSGSGSSKNSNKTSKIGWLGLLLGATAYSKASRASKAPSVYFKGCPLGGDAQVLSVKPRGRQWVVVLRIRYHHMPDYSIHEKILSGAERGIAIGSLSFGVTWS